MHASFSSSNYLLIYKNSSSAIQCTILHTKLHCISF